MIIFFDNKMLILIIRKNINITFFIGFLIVIFFYKTLKNLTTFYKVYL